MGKEAKERWKELNLCGIPLTMTMLYVRGVEAYIGLCAGLWV